MRAKNEFGSDIGLLKMKSMIAVKALRFYFDCTPEKWAYDVSNPHFKKWFCEKFPDLCNPVKS
jgi:hypothetical protein